MLRYLNSSIRDNSSRAWNVSPEVRGNWEFMAIIGGRAKPVFVDGTAFRFFRRRLWVLPPMSRHGWCTGNGERCEVIVFHFAAVPDVMERLLSFDRPASIPLSPSDISSIRLTHEEVAPHYNEPHVESILAFEKALFDLCILVADKWKRAKPFQARGTHHIHVQQALDWYRRNLAQAPTLAQIARGLNVSPLQLQAMFRKELKETPAHAFREIALHEACKMMVRSSFSLKQIALHCGFPGYGPFRRAFQERFQVQPNKWRENRFYGDLGFKSHSTWADVADISSRHP